jgi:hypothetical protein
MASRSLQSSFTPTDFSVKSRFCVSQQQYPLLVVYNEKLVVLMFDFLRKWWHLVAAYAFTGTNRQNVVDNDLLGEKTYQQTKD